MSAANIFIVTAPVHYGKTSILMNWLKTKESVGGILTPDINGERKLLRIRDGQIFPYQISNEGEYTEEECIKVGKYNFLLESFRRAKLILEEDFTAKLPYVLVDELGKLEMKDEGLEPMISTIIKSAKKQSHTKLIIVIRDYLLEEAIVKFNLQNAKVIKLVETLTFTL